MLPLILYDNILRDGTLSASGTDSEYDLNNIVDYKPYSKWKADSISSSPWIECDFGSAKTPDTIGIFNHNLNDVGGTIKLQYDNSGWVDLETITPNGDLPIMINFTGQSSTKFRLLFDSAVEIPELAIFYLGTSIEFPVPPDAPVIPFEESISGAIELSIAGLTLGAVINSHPLQVSHKYSNLSRTWLTTYFKPFWDNFAKYLVPFFYGWDLENRPDDIIFGTFNLNQTFRESLTILSLTDELILTIQSVSTDNNYSPLGES